MIGKTVSHYKILEKLGGGGMGVVYKAEDTKLKRTVALKFLPPDMTRDAEAKDRFLHEAQAASALDHPNICNIHEIGETEDGQLFIAMAHYEGETLKKKIGNGPLKLEEALDTAIQVAQGIARAHEDNIIHRDIKPANIMLTNRGEVKIVDFGLAKLAGRTQLTKEGSTLGTVAYMSPEQTQGFEADQLSDIWSLGVVLYEMLTGEQPFAGDYDQAVMYSIMNEEAEPITGLRSGVPIDLERIVNKTLAKNPNERYQHVDEMLVDLRVLTKSMESKGTHAESTRPSLVKKRQASSRLNFGSMKWPILIGGFIIFALFASVATFLFKASESDPVATEKSIAVLPFTDMSPGKDQEYFGDGMAEEIINALARTPGLKVSSRTSAFQFKGQQNDIRNIGEKLGVETILEGSVRKSSSKVRVTAQLVKVADGFHLWSNTYERQLADVFAIQDDVSRSIVKALEVTLTGDETQSVAMTKPSSVEAYNLYLRGRYFWNRRTKEGLKKAIDYFQQAIDLDPTYALAYAGLAEAYHVSGEWQYLEPKEAFTKAKAAAHKALEIDDTLAGAYAALAMSKYEYDWDWHGAERAFKRTIALNPEYATAHQWFSEFLTVMGRHVEARAEIERALELDPLSLIINAVSGRLYQWAGHDAEAIKVFKKTLEMDPDFLPAHDFLFQSYLRMGMLDESFDHFSVAYSEYYDLTNREREKVQTLYKESGWNGVVPFMIAKLEARSKAKHVPQWHMSIYYVIVEDHERALDYLEKAYQTRNPNMVHIGVEPPFEVLHSEPRLQALLRKVGLPQ
jgi:serine/threonine-protein kinase